MGLQPLRPSNLIRVMPAKEVRSIVLPRIHCITDFDLHDASTLDLLEAVVAAGVDAVQVRAKSLSDAELFGFTRALVDRLSGRGGAAVLVNDRIDIALAAGAHGVHLGAGDLPVAAARRLAPHSFLIGATCRNADDAEQARSAGADYAGVGPVYASTTKQGLPSPIGLDRLAGAARVLPAVAIAGITADRVREVRAAGAHGVAVAGAICRATDPPAAARNIVEAVSGS
jgi:thiamine-phosphate pyrophosphorylase